VGDNVRLDRVLGYAVHCAINEQPIDLTSVDLRSDEEIMQEMIKPWEGWGEENGEGPEKGTSATNLTPFPVVNSPVRIAPTDNPRR
jgi:hypothetical protein